MSADASPDDEARRPGRAWLVGSAIGAGVLVAVAVFGFQEWRLSTNLRLARQHLPLIRATLAPDNRFLGVTLAESTTLHGSIRVGGFVVDEASADELRTVIRSTSPPVAIDWQFRVLGGAAVGEALSKMKSAAATTATAPAGAERN
jgi:hypothetical protein